MSVTRSKLPRVLLAAIAACIVIVFVHQVTCEQKVADSVDVHAASRKRLNNISTPLAQLLVEGQTSFAEAERILDRLCDEDEGAYRQMRQTVAATSIDDAVRWNNASKRDVIQWWLLIKTYGRAANSKANQEKCRLYAQRVREFETQCGKKLPKPFDLDAMLQ